MRSLVVSMSGTSPGMAAARLNQFFPTLRCMLFGKADHSYVSYIWEFRKPWFLVVLPIQRLCLGLLPRTCHCHQKVCLLLDVLGLDAMRGRVDGAFCANLRRTASLLPCVQWISATSGCHDFVMVLSVLGAESETLTLSSQLVELLTLPGGV